VCLEEAEEPLPDGGHREPRPRLGDVPPGGRPALLASPPPQGGESFGGVAVRHSCGRLAWGWVCLSTPNLTGGNWVLLGVGGGGLANGWMVCGRET